MEFVKRAVEFALLSLFILLPVATDATPNIIFILADDLGYGDLGCYGQKKIKTPNIDKLAAGGMRFTDFYAGSTVCAPSRCCLMTGLHTGHARIRGNDTVPLRPDDTTVAEILKNAGYATSLFGKWGLGEPDTTGVPNKKGFDEFFGYLNQVHAHDSYPEFLWQNEEKFPLEGNKNGAKKEFSNDLFTSKAADYLNRMKDGSKPFFLYLAYTIPHANNELGAKTGNGIEVPSDAPYTSENWPQPERNFAASITRMDSDIGKLMDLLKKIDLDHKTIVFFSSDNGPHHEGGHSDKFFESSGPLRGAKRDLYEGGIRVPLIVRWPEQIKGGSINDHPLAFWDFQPTAAELAGAEAPKNVDGLSFLPTLLGKSQADHPYLYWEFHEKGFSQAIRSGTWKAVRININSPLELFDLKNDASETKNIPGSSIEIVQRIEKLFETARTDSEHWPIK